MTKQAQHLFAAALLVVVGSSAVATELANGASTGGAANSINNRPNNSSAANGTAIPVKRTATATAATSAAATPSAIDARMKTLVFRENQAVEVAVARGVVTQIVLAPDEQLQYQPAMGVGSDCKREGDAWCVAYFGRDIFIKPRTGADTSDMAVVTNRRRYTFLLTVLPPSRAGESVLRLSFEPPEPAHQVAQIAPAPTSLPLQAAAPSGPPPLTAQQLIENRMRLQPQVRNSDYSVAVGESSEDIVPTMVFDDGTHTYFTFPNNRPVPTIFQTAPDQSEEMVNAGMQDDMLVADRVARRFVLRLGNAVVAIVNERFDLDGQPPVNGTTVPGVARVLRGGQSSEAFR